MQVRLDDAALDAQALSSEFAHVPSDWRAITDAFVHSPAGEHLLARLRGELAAGHTVYPHDVLAALRWTRLDDVRVVILAQDPYHGPGQAHGLAFSVPDGVKPPPSLRNIFKELQRDVGVSMPATGKLTAWAQHGVLLLNSALTVRAEQAGSHAGWGWEALTDALVAHVAAHASPKVFMLWGAHAQRKQALIEASAGEAGGALSGCRHLLLLCNHPSPLSAMRGPTPFIGCGHFSQAQQWLQTQGRGAVPVWQA